MGNFKQTSNVSITITKEFTSRTSVNNEEAHTKQIVLTGNARADYKKYNYEFPTKYSEKKYRDVIWQNLRTGTKFDKACLTEDEFWTGRVYKTKNTGKTTTYLESMTFAPPWRIHPDQIEQFLNSPENMYFEDIRNFLLSDEQFKGCLFLRFQVHMNEIYIPESITLDDGTEKMLKEDERWAYAYIKPHMTVDYIPTVFETDKDGKEYRQLSRTKLWKSREGRYNQSYSEFNTRKYEAVDHFYGLERGELYSDRKPEEQPVRRSLEEYQKTSDDLRIKRLIEQQKKENAETLNIIEKEAESIIEANGILKDAQEELLEDIQSFVSDFPENEKERVENVILQEERSIFIDLINKITDIIRPLEKIAPMLFTKIINAFENAMKKIEIKEQIREAMKENINQPER